MARGATGKRRNGEPGRIGKRNRARILQAAEALFAERGFSGATMAAIAARAGLPGCRRSLPCSNPISALG